MSKINFNLLPLMIFGLMTTTGSAHAESFLESMNKKLTTISQEVTDQIKKQSQEVTVQIKKQYESVAPAPMKTPPPVITPVKVVVKAPPVETPAQAIRKKLAECQKFLGYMYGSTYETDTKKIATSYLNGAVDFSTLDFDKKPTREEIEERNKCIELALDLGADPDGGVVKNDDDQSLFKPTTPLARAVRNNHTGAVKILLDHKADPNIKDSLMGNAIPLLNIALYKSQEMALDLIAAGADLSTPHLLWIAAGNAADKVVDELILSKKIPVNQLNKFTDYADEEGETALDSSENRLATLVKYQNKIASDSTMSQLDKLSEANRILYYSYPLQPQLKMSESIDPDAFINDLMNRQQNVSNSLKAAGGVCKLKNCGITELNDLEAQ